MRGNFERCLWLLWEGETACNGKERQLGLTKRTIAAWRGCLVKQLEARPLERGEAAAILHCWFWRGIRADELPAGLDYALFDHAVQAGPKQAALDLRHILNLRTLDTGQGVDGLLIRAAERANLRSTIVGLSTFRRDARRELVTKRAISMLEARDERIDAA